MRRKSAFVAPAILAGALIFSACTGADTATQPAEAENAPAPSIASDAPAETPASDSDNAETGGDGTSPQSPLALGTTVENDNWSVVVHSVQTGATQEVVAGSPANTPPPDGEEYVLVNLTVTYVGPAATGQPPVLVAVDWTTSSGADVPQTTVLALPPDPIDPVTILQTNESVTGNLALQVPSPGDGVLAITPGPGATTVYVATS